MLVIYFNQIGNTTVFKKSLHYESTLLIQIISNAFHFQEGSFFWDLIIEVLSKIHNPQS